MKILLPLTALLGIVACERETPPVTLPASEPDSDGKLVVACVNYPLAFFAERIGGDDVTVFFPEIEGDPAYWEPNDEEVTRFQNAGLILRNGANYAKWAGKVSLPESSQIDTGQAFAGALIEVEEDAAHVHGNGEVHSHKGVAFTTWLDIENARLQAGAIANALAQKLPDKSGEIGERLQSLTNELDSIDAELIDLGQKFKGKPVIGSHPVYQYLATAYGFEMQAVHWEPGIVPDLKAMREIETKNASHNAKLMIWEDQPKEESIQKLETLGMKSVVFNPCGNRPAEGDFLSVMQENIKNLRAALE